MAAEPARSATRVATDALRQSAETLSQRLPALLVEADRVAATVVSGVHGRRRTGMGETFWQFRQYQPGDSTVGIDWRQSAKSRQLFVREQEWEAAESVWLWCDLSRSMTFRSGPGIPAKWERAVLLVLALAGLLVRGGERVAFLGSGTRPAGGRYGMDQLVRGLERAGKARDPVAALPRFARLVLVSDFLQPLDRLQERVAFLGSGTRPAGGRYGMDQLVRGLERAGKARDPVPPVAALPRFARLVLVSDFLQPLDRLQERFGRYVALGARGCVMQILDPAEELLPYEGRVLFEGMEQEGAALIDNVGSVRSRYVQILQAHRESLAASCVRQGWRFVHHRTDRSAETALLSLVAMLAPRALG